MKRAVHRRIALCLAAALILALTGCTGGNDSAEQPETSAGSGASQNTAGSVTFSQAGGLYERAFALQLSTDIKNGAIRYTLDGSDPTSESAKYDEAITIADRTDEENLLSAIVISGSGGGGGNFGGGRGGNGAAMPEMPGGGFPDDAVPPPDMAGGGAAGGDNVPQRPGMDDTNRAAGPGGGGAFGGGAVSAPEENVFKGTVVKAAVFSEKGEMLSDISIQSYFVSEDIFTRYGGLPIVSIVTDADNFFNDETGIYANYNQSGSDWERGVYFEMFETDGTSVISQNMGVRINGGSTRSLAQKALRFYAKSSYDEENPTIEYEIFEGLTTSYNDDLLTSFKRIILRSSGNDNSGTLFRDALTQELVSDLNVDTQASRPCIAFVNGEFWGIYNIRERYDDQYFANHYGIDTDKVAILEISQDTGSTPGINEGDESDLEYYNEMWNFFNDNSMTDAENYRKAQEYLDIDNFIDYYVANIYSGNTDWPANNNEFWRYKTENGGYDDTAKWYMDGRFRWVVKDMDWGFGYMGQASSDTLAHAMNESGSSTGGNRAGGTFTSSESTLMFRRLLENEEFLAKFINRFCDVMNTNYEESTVVTLINEKAAEIKTAIPEQANRYPSSVSSIESWESKVNTMSEFARQRTGYVQGFLQSKFSLSDVVRVTLNTDSEAGYIRINGRDISTDTPGVSDASSWSGSYFADTTQTFTAVPLDGHTFVKFVVTDIATGATTEYTTDSIEVALGTGGTVAQVVFQ